MKVSIEIQTGNEAMQDLQDIAAALIQVARKFQDNDEPGYVMDLNGNKVGKINYEYENVDYRFYDIVWDTDDEDVDLPDEVVLPVSEDVDPSIDGADVLSDHFGWCVTSFQSEKQ